MTYFYRLLLSVSLSVLIVITGAPFQLFLEARAQSVEADQQAEEDNRKAIEELRKAFADPAKGEAQLDPFQLTRQRVTDDRRQNLDAILETERLDDFKERIEFMENRIVELKELEAKVDARLVNANNSDKVAELNLIKDDIVSRRKLVELDLKDTKQFDPRFGEAIPVDYMIDQDLRKKHYWGRRLRVKVGGIDGALGDIHQRKFTESLSPTFNSENPVKSGEGKTGFVLTDHKDRPLNEFFKPVEALFFFGQYLVFVEKEAVEKSGKTLPVRIIDLNYFRANIGNAPLPVFTLPLNITEKPTDFRLENGRLVIGEHRLSYQQLAMVAKTQQVIFNVNVALVDPASYKNAQPLIQEIAEFFAKGMEGQSELFQEQLKKAVNTTELIENSQKNLGERPNYDIEKARALIGDVLGDGKLSTQEFDSIKKVLDANQASLEANDAIRDGRKFFTRLRLLLKFLVQPRPEGAPKLFNSLVILATKSKEARERVLEFGKNSFLFKLTKYGAATGGVVVASTFLPEPYTLNLQKSMDLISAMSQHFQGYLQHINYGKAYGELAKDAFITSTTGWTYFVQSYLSEGKWAKFLYGLGSVLLIPLQLFAAIHFSVNTVKMAVQVARIRGTMNKSPGIIFGLNGQKIIEKITPAPEVKTGKIGFLEAFKMAAADDQKAYWDSLAESEKKVSGSDVELLKEGEIKLLEEHIERLRSGREGVNAVERDIRRGKYGTRSSLRRVAEILAGFAQKIQVGEAISGTFQKLAGRLSLKGGEGSFQRALSESFLSYSSLRTTFKFNAYIWNYLFVTRSFFWSPSKWLMLLIYPNYFGVTLSDGVKQHIPSNYNRGLELWPEKLRRAVSRAGQTAGLGNAPIVKNLFISKAGLEALGNFEKAIMPIEDVAKEIALKKAQIALIENIKDPARVMNIFDSSQNRMGVSTGIKSLYDPKIKKLTNKERLFYRAYFTRTFDLMMQHFLVELSSTKQTIDMTPEQFSRQLKAELRSGQDLELRADEKTVLDVEKAIESRIDFAKVRAWANKVGQNGQNIITRMNIQFRHTLLQGISPTDAQMQRFLTVREKVNEPRSMERAMRMEVTSLISSIPLGIVSTLALYAGVQTGVIMPFDPEGMNTETHFRYMSRYLFYNGFIPGLIVGLLANTWMKLQEDHRLDALGGFNKSTKFSDGKRGFWRFYLKNAFKNPVNKWSANHIYMLKLITANIPAAAVTIIAANLYGLGRLDVGAFIGGYVMVYATFLAGFSVKLEQAFELASSWVSNRVPRYLRAHKLAQKYINSSLQKRKIAFSYFETAWGIIVDENIAGTMLVLKDNVKYGTRAFLRLLFGGEPPTTLIVNTVDMIVRSLKAVPGVESAGDVVKKLFSHQYEAFERFPERLPLPPEGVERVVENPNLPKHTLGEALGKTGAFAGTVGAVTAVPYIVTDAINRVKEARTHARGRKLRCAHIFRPQK